MILGILILIVNAAGFFVLGYIVRQNETHAWRIRCIRLEHARAFEAQEPPRSLKQIEKEVQA